MTITMFSQINHPKEGLRVTEISQEPLISFDKWLVECEKVAKQLKYKSCKSMNIQGILRTYYKANLTPVQAVKKYFI